MDIILALQKYLSGVQGLRLAILFGSRAAGKEHVHSDVDLGVLLEQRLDAARKQQLMEGLAEATGSPIDLVDLYDCPEPIMTQVIKGKRVLGDSSAFAALLSRHLVEVADYLPLYERVLKERREAWTKSF